MWYTRSVVTPYSSVKGLGNTPTEREVRVREGLRVLRYCRRIRTLVVLAIYFSRFRSFLVANKVSVLFYKVGIFIQRLNKKEAISLPKRIRPVRIWAHWQREIMATVANEESGVAIWNQMKQQHHHQREKKSCPAHLFIEWTFLTAVGESGIIKLDITLLTH